MLDKENMFSDAQAITAAAKSTNVIDLSDAGRDIGVGENLYVGVFVSTAFTDAGSDSTLTVDLEQDDDSGMASPVKVQEVGILPALAAIGAKIISRIDPLKITERYLQLSYTPNNGNLTTGAVKAYLVKDIDAFKAYADAITIS